MQNLTVLFFSKFHNGFKGILPVVRKKEAKTRGLKETTSTAKAEILGYSPNGAIISIWCVKKKNLCDSSSEFVTGGCSNC